MSSGRSKRATPGRPSAPAAPASKPGEARSGWELARFVLVFVGCLAAGAVLLDVQAIRSWLVEPWTKWNAASAAIVATWVGIPTQVDGTLLSIGGATLNILDGCNGAQAVLIYLSAVLAFPAAWPSRAAGVLLGTAILFGANLVRLLSLLVVARYFPAQLELVHVYVWQVLIVLVACGLFLAWAGRSSPPRSHPAAAGGP